VVAAVRFAAETGLKVTVRGGGHSVGGLAVQDGTLLLDLGGMISTTGIGGLTVGGGIGWLIRKYGLASDNLLGAEVVLASGESVRAR